MNNRNLMICPKCREKQTTASMAINDFSDEKPVFNNISANIFENDGAKMNCCVFCNTSFWGYNDEHTAYKS